MSTRILILCPHNAAKSVAAAAYLRRAADELDLDLHIETAGTHPDPDVNPVVRQGLEGEGLTARSSPRTVTEPDLARADRIVNIGCVHSELPTERQVEDWTIPDFSADPGAAFAALKEHVSELARELHTDDRAVRSRTRNP